MKRIDHKIAKIVNRLNQSLGFSAGNIRVPIDAGRVRTNLVTMCLTTRRELTDPRQSTRS